MSDILTPSQLAEDTVVLCLQSQATGLVVVTMQLAEAAGIAMPPLDLDEQTGKQLFRSGANANEFIGSDNPEFPAVFVYVTQTHDQHRLKFGNDFSGEIMLGIDILLTTDEPTIPELLQKQANIYNDALYKVFGVAALGIVNGNGINMGDGVRVARQRPVKGGENWLMQLTATIQFYLN